MEASGSIDLLTALTMRNATFSRNLPPLRIPSKDREAFLAKSRPARGPGKLAKGGSLKGEAPHEETQGPAEEVVLPPLALAAQPDGDDSEESPNREFEDEP